MLHASDEQDPSASVPDTSNPVPLDVNTGTSEGTHSGAYTPRRRGDRRRAARHGSASVVQRRLHPIHDDPWSGDPWSDTSDDHGIGTAQDVTNLQCGPSATAEHSTAAGQVQPPPYDPNIDGSSTRTFERPPQSNCPSPWLPCEELSPNGRRMLQQNSLHDPRCSHTCQTPGHLPNPWEVQYSHEHDQLYSGTGKPDNPYGSVLTSNRGSCATRPCSSLAPSLACPLPARR